LKSEKCLRYPFSFSPILHHDLSLNRLLRPFHARQLKPLADGAGQGRVISGRTSFGAAAVKTNLQRLTSVARIAPTIPPPALARTLFVRSLLLVLVVYELDFALSLFVAVHKGSP
jgi:hypothetical protein